MNKESVSFEELIAILHRFESMERILKDSGQLKPAGEEFLTSMMDVIRDCIKKTLFYVLKNNFEEDA